MNRQLLTVDAVSLDGDAVADAQIGVREGERSIRAVVHSHADAVVLVGAAMALLDFVADQRAADRAGDGRCGVAAAAADL